MSRAVVAEFAREADFLRALEAARAQGRAIAEAFSPYLPETEKQRPDPGPGRVTLVLAVGGLVSAAAFYLLEWWSATRAYPFDSGSRPPNSWPTFMLAPFEFGVFAAGVAGFLAFLALTGLPRLHHPVFDVPGFERVSQDRFFIVFAEPGEETQSFARGQGATAVRELEL